MFTEIIVEEVIGDPSLYTQDHLRSMITKISNKRYLCDEPQEQLGSDADPPDESQYKYFLRAPRNSIIGRPKGDANGHDNVEGEEYLHVYYPFFSSHFCLPVKPGETVWAFDGDGVGYWMTRVCQPIHTEDLNFTHSDRKDLPIVNSIPIKTPDADLEDTSAVIDTVPRFPNGSKFENRETDIDGILTAMTPELEEEFDDLNIRDYSTFQILEDGISHYETIYSNNLEIERITYEPVPKLTKRPGDLILQGSNNSAIILGTDRGYTIDERPDGETTNADEGGPRQRAGSIDIVAGRGRIHDSYEDVADSPAEETRCAVVENSRLDYENHKYKGSDIGKAPDGGHIIDVSEGDPDFIHDSSRMYITMNTLPDYNFGIDYPDVPPVGSSNEGQVIEILQDFDDDGRGQAAAILKSDEVRIIARQDLELDPPIQGSITLIKEGIPDSEDGDGRGIITIRPDGVIMIDGPKIVIGSGISKGNGAGDQISFGLNASEPLVLGQQLVDRLTALETTFNNHFHNSGAGPTAPASTTSPSAEAWTTILSTIGKTL